MSGNKVRANARFREFIRPMLILGNLALFLTTLSSCVPGDSLQPKNSLSAQALSKCKKIPVIFDTDIGDDIDDTWALALLLQSPELDVKLITTGSDGARARIVAKMLEVAGRTDIPIGVGLPILKPGDESGGGPQKEWVKNYKLSSYPGIVYQDGVQAMVDIIMNSPKPVTVIAVGPLPNVAAALERKRRTAKKANFIGMHGSIRRGYGGRAPASKEYNVVKHVKKAQKVFRAGWDMTITPLDTCGIVSLRGEKYQKVLERDSPLTRALIENYRAWAKRPDLVGKVDVNKASTTLFDTVAVYLAVSTKLVKMERLGIRVTDDGYTVIDKRAKKMNCATKWKNLSAFEDFLVERLTK